MRDYTKAAKHVQPYLWANKVHVRKDGCHVWLAAKSVGGYGRFTINRESFYAHRLAYAMKHGSVDSSLVIDHTCRNRDCVNPDHMELVSQAENVRRGLHGVLRTHCQHGHSLEDASTRSDHAGARRCRTCERERSRKRQGYYEHPNRGAHE